MAGIMVRVSRIADYREGTNMAKTSSNITFGRAVTALLLCLVLLGSVLIGSAWAQSQTMQSYQELFERSQKEKKGLTFYVDGQTISGVVVKLIGTEAVEIRNQTYSRIIIRLEASMR
jgi:hypothetical protein